MTNKYEENIFGEKIPVKPRTPELKATQNFIVFYFDDPEDWDLVKKEFKLKNVSSLEGKPEGTRIGRVVNGKELIEKID